MEEKEFIYLKLGILETENYIVHVGTVPGDKVPQYLIFNKQHGVLEFAHNMIYFINEAIEEMEQKLKDQKLDKSEESTAEEEKPKKNSKKRVVN